MKDYKVGDIVRGVVTGIENYGIFLLIDNEINGLIHISELSELFVRDVSEYANLNETINAKIIEYDKQNKKMKLTIKDVDYRDNIINKHGIIETKNGFKNLSKKLDDWIVKKQEEYK